MGRGGGGGGGVVFGSCLWILPYLPRPVVVTFGGGGYSTHELWSKLLMDNVLIMFFLMQAYIYYMYIINLYRAIFMNTDFNYLKTFASASHCPLVT